MLLFNWGGGVNIKNIGNKMSKQTAALDMSYGKNADSIAGGLPKNNRLAKLPAKEPRSLSQDK